MKRGIYLATKVGQEEFLEKIKSSVNEGKISLPQVSRDLGISKQRTYTLYNKLFEIHPELPKLRNNISINNDEVLSLVKEGHSITEVRSKLHVSYSKVKLSLMEILTENLNKNSIDELYKYKAFKSLIREQFINDIKKSREQKFTNKDIAKKFEIKRSSVDAICYQLMNKGEVLRRRRTAAEMSQLLFDVKNLLEENYTYSKIADYLKIKPEYVQYLVKKINKNASQTETSGKRI